MTSQKSNNTTQIADIDLSDNNTPFSRAFDDVYFSKEHGLNESYYVFFQGNRLDERWHKENFGLSKNTSVFTIGETGFGTGLNFLMTWREWKKMPAPKPRLHFYSTEKFPLTKEALAQALLAWPELADLSQPFIESYPPQPHNGLYRLIFEEGSVNLTIYFGDALEGFEHMLPCKLPNIKIESLVKEAQHSDQQISLPRIDAWYFDGFAPSKNPSMWQHSLFEAAAKLCHSTTTFATFTAAGDVRRLLNDIGFQCKKRKGFGRKREMLWGEFHPQDTSTENEDASRAPPPHRPKRGAVTHDHDSWHMDSKTYPPVKHCVIIGGGLAGCHSAYALAKRGIKVTLLEKNSALADEASGNKQGVVYAKLSPHRSPSEGPLSYFNFYGFLFANAFYHSNKFYEKVGSQCGVLQLATNNDQIEQYQEFCQGFQGESPFSWLTPEKCSALSGVNIQHPGLFIQNAGWLSPSNLCKALTNHSNISIEVNSNVNEISSNDKGHTLHLHNGTTINADAVVIACAHHALKFEHCKRLPLKSIRGQVTHLPSKPSMEKLKCVICGDGYVAPLYAGESTTGASFNLKEQSQEMSARDHHHNIEKLHVLSTDFCEDYSLNHIEHLKGRVGFRCTTPDYFPIAGPLPIYDEMGERFIRYTKKANAHIENTGVFHRHMYALLGLGSRGLTYAPLAAEVIASYMCGEFFPVEQDIVRYLHPARFLIRDLKRNKV